MDLVERIGLEQDTNQTQSIRMLLLEESESLLRQDLHDDLLRSIVGRYLSDSEDAKPGPPRFLVNDVIRYWRTLTVDYAAKRHEQLSPEWGLRYLKLIVSRKLTYAGTLVSLLSCGEGRPASVEHLVEQFRMPALARLGQLHTMLSESAARAALAETLEIADWFNGRLGDSVFRDGMKAVVGKNSTDEAFVEAVNKARRLQSCLETIFFESALLRRPAMTYLSF